MTLVRLLSVVMCILFLIANANPASDGYKLILASNRDEYFVRPALAAAPWKENPFVFGGRDMEPGCEGGTWLAISAKDKIFKFGALLNILGESHDEDATKRGNLVSDFVSDTKTSQEYLSELVNNGKKYNGYNLVTIEMRSVALMKIIIDQFLNRNLNIYSQRSRCERASLQQLWRNATRMVNRTSARIWKFPTRDSARESDVRPPEIR